MIKLYKYILKHPIIIILFYLIVGISLYCYRKWFRKKYKKRLGKRFYYDTDLFDDKVVCLNEEAYNYLKKVQREGAPLTKIEQKFVDEIEKFDDIFALQKRAENYVMREMLKKFERDQWEYIDALEIERIYKEPGQPEIIVNPYYLMQNKVQLDPQIQEALEKIEKIEMDIERRREEDAEMWDRIAYTYYTGRDSYW